ncbi:MAG: HAD family hydrolase [Syntrophomonadaceae bacterium]|jgi:HAD superfamily hydrolase (TIGR01490 family)
MNLAIFDFDGTLLTRDTLPALAKEWLRQKRSRAKVIVIYLSLIPTFIRYKLRLINREKFKNIAFDKFNRIYQGMTKKEINEFFQSAYPNLKKKFNTTVIKEIRTARQQKFHCVLLSGSYADLLRIVAHDLGIDTVIGAELAFREGIVDHRGVPFINGKKKVALLQKTFTGKIVNWDSSRCFADSVADIELMQLVGEPVAVNPDPGLLSYALENQWKIVG